MKIPLNHLKWGFSKAELKYQIHIYIQIKRQIKITDRLGEGQEGREATTEREADDVESDFAEADEFDLESGDAPLEGKEVQLSDTCT
ncbi:hypothetical protein L1987_54789 [Smallanthus sonchifolius]|uniref:Uncharacterized protein n=1 Tax=Smallanthus sonchifolius TaxID=185202 RepID=A0ACB9E842_9ASTR|nr:hypothetical protein L1987_54789 [Smallanthus sonchifolius]